MVSGDKHFYSKHRQLGQPLRLIKQETVEEGLVCGVAFCRFEDTVKEGNISQ